MCLPPHTHLQNLQNRILLCSLVSLFIYTDINLCYSFTLNSNVFRTRALYTENDAACEHFAPSARLWKYARPQPSNYHQARDSWPWGECLRWKGRPKMVLLNFVWNLQTSGAAAAENLVLPSRCQESSSRGLHADMSALCHARDAGHRTLRSGCAHR